MKKVFEKFIVGLLSHGPAMVTFSLGMGLLIWQIIAKSGRLPSFMLPSPLQVWNRFLLAVKDGTLLSNTAVTLLEVMAGLALGVSVATVMGYLIARSHRLERLLAPYVVGSQSVPVVAIAPLLIIWFGPGLISKVLICSLTVFFPVLVNTVVGIRSAPEDLRDLMRSLQATSWQMLYLMEAPAALPVFLGGLRIGATLSVIGAVVGEFAGADRGLGFLINVSRGLYDNSLVFVAVFTLMAMSLTLYGIVVLMEVLLTSWKQSH